MNQICPLCATEAEGRGHLKILALESKDQSKEIEQVYSVKL